MTGIVLMLSNYFHDLSVALLVTNILAVIYVGRFLEGSPVRDRVVGDLYRKLTRVTYAALAYVILAGAVRAWFFMDFEWNPAVGRGQVPALVVKHVVLVAAVLFGLIGHRRYRERYGV